MTPKPTDARPREKAHRKRRRALDAYARLQRAAALSAAAADAALSPFGLSASQYGVLETLSTRGTQHQQELARALGRSKAQMTAIIDQLEARELAVRERHPTDRRYTSVRLTEAGAALLAEAAPARAEAVVQLMSELSGDQRTRLGRLCRRLVRALAPDEPGNEEEDETEATGEPDDDGSVSREPDADAAASGASPE